MKRVWATYVAVELQLVRVMGQHFRDEIHRHFESSLVDGSSKVELTFSRQNASFYSRSSVTLLPRASVHVGVYRNVFR